MIVETKDWSIFSTEMGSMANAPRSCTRCRSRRWRWRWHADTELGHGNRLVGKHRLGEGRQVPPLRCLPAGHLLDLATQATDQAGLLGQRDVHLRRDRSLLGMRPPRERLDTAQAVAVDREDGW